MAEHNMSSQWYMLTIVGKDQKGIVAKVTSTLYDLGCNLGETSMLRLGGNFTMMMMVSSNANEVELQSALSKVSRELGLHIHIDAIDGRLHDHREPNVRISVYGADRAGIVSQVTTALADAGLEILDLESDVGGSSDKPIYVMHLEGHAPNGIDVLNSALASIKSDGIQIHLEAIDTLIG